MLNFQLNKLYKPEAFVPFGSRGELVWGATAKQMQAWRENQPVQFDDIEQSITKAIANPAMATGSPLTRDSLAEFHDQVTQQSAFKLLKQYDLDGFQKLTFPVRQANPNMAGAFRNEGDPIRVGAVGMRGASLRPRSLGVIAVASEEIMQRSYIDLAKFLKDQIIIDTQKTIDQLAFSALPAAGEQPAGLFNGRPQITAATEADVFGAYRQLTQTMANWRTPIVVMHQSTFAYLGLVRSALGLAVFPNLFPSHWDGVPVLIRNNVSPQTVYALDASDTAATFRLASIKQTNEGTVVEDDTTPSAVDGTLPTRSLFQTGATAIRAVFECDWTMLNARSAMMVLP